MSRRSLRTGEHPDWCAGGHRCGLGEHRADPVVAEVRGLGRALLTRVRATDGREHAEVTLTVALSDAEPYARVQLGGLLADLNTVMRRVTRASRQPRR
ncbi:hypothetical protein Daura_06520 [Dactylosporangium aurantiacum]|uniref:Uncharacterized protein n=1 Tax=Dactylosporangium aurantiacum TaxID=35754 RepID=A0A9Q9IJA9_9ACTN|nr:hypothetical protein [Dactylosporangium aurantiacum]MDG6106113.1 hypothetical protein [Dactylosporangium aurantiacum]UWZ55848.1 hypothetical protein Daura_06520 [Dactylosporangium aurantiacum]